MTKVRNAPPATAIGVVFSIIVLLRRGFAVVLLFLSFLTGVAKAQLVADPPTKPPTTKILDLYPWHLARITAEKASEMNVDTLYGACSNGLTSDNKRVHVYLIDSGTKRAHTEFGATEDEQKLRVDDGVDFTRVVAGDTPGLAHDPCAGWPDPFIGDASLYERMLGGAGHGTATASLINGKTLGVAKEAMVVPLRVLPCETQGQTWIPNYPYRKGATVADGTIYRAAVDVASAIPPSADSGRWMPDTGGLSKVQAMIAAFQWLTAHAETPAVVSMSTWAHSTEAGLDNLRGAIQTFEAAKDVLVIASANNQDIDASTTFPAGWSCADHQSGCIPNLLVVGGLMLHNDPVVHSGDGQIGQKELPAHDDSDTIQGKHAYTDAPWLCGAGDSVNCPGVDSVTHELANKGSNYGPKVEIWAPAKNIGVASLEGPYSYRDRNGVNTLASGTSWSAPIVAGIAARFLSTRPFASGDDVKTAVLAAAKDGALEQRALNAFSGNSVTDVPNKVAFASDVVFLHQPIGTTIIPGSSAQLTVDAAAPTGAIYQWYAGARGDTNHPVAGGTTVSVTVSPATTTSYWVRVSGSCASRNYSADSAVARVQVTCSPAPSISLQPKPYSEYAVTHPESPVELTVTASPNATFQWHARAALPGSTSILAGTDQSIFVRPLADMTYWVTVSSSAGCSVDSEEANVVVIELPVVPDPPFDAIPDGLAVTPRPLHPLHLKVTGRNLTFHWKHGNDDFPDCTTATCWVSPANPTSVTVSNNAGDVSPLPITVPYCYANFTDLTPLPDVQKSVGATLEVKHDQGGVVTVVTDATCQWYYGLAGDTSRPLPLATTMSSHCQGTLTETSQKDEFYWVQVTGTDQVTGAATCSRYSTTGRLYVTDCARLLGNLPAPRLFGTPTDADTKVTLVLDIDPTDKVQWNIIENGVPRALAGANKWYLVLDKPTGLIESYDAVVATSDGACPGVHSPSITISSGCNPPRIRAVRTNPGPPPNVTPTGSAFELSVPVDDDDAGAVTVTWFAQDSHPPVRQVGTGYSMVVTPKETTSYYAVLTRTCSTHPTTTTAPVVIGISIPEVKVVAFPGTVIGTLSTFQLAALQSDATAFAGGTTFEWRAAKAEGNGTFSKDPYSPVLNSNSAVNSFWGGPIVDQAAYWVRVHTPEGLEPESDLVFIIVKCEEVLPSVVVVLDRVDHHVQLGAPVIFSAVGAGRNLIYQWYHRSLEDPSHSDPVGSGGGVFWTSSPDGTYWVHATDDCGRTAEAETTVYLCTPTIPDNVSPPDVWIKSGTSAHLSVNATTAQTGQSLHYQWYEGSINLPMDKETLPALDIDHAGTFLANVSSDCVDHATSGVWSAPMTVHVCTPPALGMSPGSRDTRSGTTEVLHVSTSGDALTYQWYRGIGDASNPIPDGTTDTISVMQAVDSDYWVRVADHGVCVTDSAVIHLTVCFPPAIATQPAGKSVFSGNTATLTVAATPMTAAPLHYAWFEVAADGSQIAVSGNDSPSFTTPALTTSRTWFVRVYSGNQLTMYTDSQPATIYVCDMPTVFWATPPRPLMAGEVFTLQIYAPPVGSRMTWYRGVSGDVSMPISATDVPYTEVVPNAPTATYWVRVQKGDCWADSGTLTLNVCVPQITQQPAGGPPITPGGSVSLSVIATTTQLTYQWYKGASGDVSQPIAGATSATYSASPSVDTLYWVRVTGFCGVTADSNAAQVTVCPPPAIVSNAPATQWAIIGSGSTTVSVNATGGNLTYQWYTGNSGNTAAPISGATASSLTLTPQNTTSYWVRVSGSCGPSQDSVTMLVNVCGSPAITAQPQGSTIFSGGTATMSVAVSEATTTPVTYQWYRGATGDASTPVGTGSTTFTTPALTAQTSYWVRVSCGICTPADSQAATVSICTYPQTFTAPADQFIAIGQPATLNAINASGNVYQWYIGASGNTSQPAPGASNLSSYTASPSVTTQYWAQVQNGGCISRTESATVYVCVPTITQQPAGTMINSGASTTLSVAANTSGLTYRWYVGNSGTTTTPIAGATTSSVTVSPTVATSYWVRVTGSCSRSVDSAAATVTICAPPAINGAASTQSIVRNSSTSCFVTATGTNLTYQWYVGASGDTSTPIAGATASSVTVTPQNTTSYWARVTGTCGTVNSVTMLVNVCATPVITAQPQGSIIFSGGTASMSVTATEGTTTGMTYQWYRGATGDVSAPVGTNSTSFTTPALTAQTSYWVRVSCGICNPVDSQAATISICYYPQTLGSPGDFYNTVGQSVRLYTVNANGNTYQWYTGASGDPSHAYSSNLYYADVAPTVTTQYWAQVQNGGCISRTATANVYVCIPTFTQQPASATIAPGSSTTLTAAANTAGVTYQWYTGASGNTAAPIAGATGPSVTVTPGSDTSYWVRAIGTCGRTTDSATASVVLCSPPVITSQPAGSAVYGGGSTASMWVYATGSNITYQWYTGNSGDMTYPISGATSSNSSLLIYSTQKVWVRITGSCGAVNSNATFISVYPTISQQPPSSLIVGYNATASISLSASGSYMSYVWKNSSTGAVIATTTTPTLITPAITTNMGIYCLVYSGNASTNSWESDLSVCYNGPNVSIVKAPNGACSVAYVNYGSGAADDYQWYQGARGDTSHLVSSGSTALYVCPTVATEYWLRAVVWSSPQVVSCYTDSNSVTLP